MPKELGRKKSMNSGGYLRGGTHSILEIVSEDEQIDYKKKENGTEVWASTFKTYSSNKM